LQAQADPVEFEQVLSVVLGQIRMQTIATQRAALIVLLRLHRPLLPLLLSLPVVGEGAEFALKFCADLLLSLLFK